MGLDIDFSAGQTPLDGDELEGLLIPTITTRGELDEFEQLGVQRAVAWTLGKKFSVDRILSEEFIRSMHQRMFAEIWTWAGQFRKTNKNIGVDKTVIGIELRKLIDDCRYWIEHAVYPEDEIAIRFSHRLVVIHPFTNGNGRHSRLVSDILVHHGLGKPIFTWGSAQLRQRGEAREAYLHALREADKNKFESLIQFARL